MRPGAIKAGLVGRGSLIGSLFKEHGGFELFAVADYFQPVADTLGEKLGVDKSRRFSGLSAYQKLIDTGVEVVILEDIPWFMPDQAEAAAKAGCHVYMAKPVAVDVPGALQVEAAARIASQKRRCFFVDYQIPTDPFNQEVMKRVQERGVGKIAQLATFGLCNGFSDPPKTVNLESRLHKLIWVNDIELGCDYLGNFDIHALDAALWVMGVRPVAAAGSSQVVPRSFLGRSDRRGHGVCPDGDSQGQTAERPRESEPTNRGRPRESPQTHRQRGYSKGHYSGLGSNGRGISAADKGAHCTFGPRRDQPTSKSCGAPCRSCLRPCSGAS